MQPPLSYPRWVQHIAMDLTGAYTCCIKKYFFFNTTSTMCFRTAPAVCPSHCQHSATFMVGTNLGVVSPPYLPLENTAFNFTAATMVSAQQGRHHRLRFVNRNRLKTQNWCCCQLLMKHCIGRGIQ